MKNVIKYGSTMFVAVIFGLSISFFTPVNSKAAMESSYCDTFDEDYSQCNGHPTNCLCDVGV